jgi:hypothetical protein
VTLTAKTLATLSEHDIDPDAFLAYADCYRENQDASSEAVEDFLDRFDGEFASSEEWAKKTLYMHVNDSFDEGVGDFLTHLLNYVNFFEYARDCELNGDIYVIESRKTGETYVFKGN